MASSIEISALDELVNKLKTSSTSTLDPQLYPVMGQMREETRDLVGKVEQACRQVSLANLGILDESLNWRNDEPSKGNSKGTRSSQDKGDKATDSLEFHTQNKDRQVAPVINWLLKTCTAVVDKLNQHGVIMSALLAHHEADIEKIKEEVKVVKEEVEVEKKRIDHLEVENDEVKQRGMKGTLIISSTKRHGQDSSFIKKNSTGRATELESELDMVLRLVMEKTGVIFSKGDISDFHPLGKDKRNPSSFLLRVWNRKPGSSWEVLREGLRTGKMKDSPNYFDPNLNLNISYMLTKRRGDLAKATKELREKVMKEGKLKKGESVFKYSHDENGVLWVKSVWGKDGKFERIHSLPELHRLAEVKFGVYV